MSFGPRSSSGMVTSSMLIYALVCVVINGVIFAIICSSTLYP